MLTLLSVRAPVAMVSHGTLCIMLTLRKSTAFLSSCVTPEHCKNMSPSLGGVDANLHLHNRREMALVANVNDDRGLRQATT